MNVLVTNTRNGQAYAIIRALRPYANKIVATMYGSNRLIARLGHAANSRLVDKRCYVPSPVEDWRAGTIQRENTEREEAYIQAVMRVCEKERIDAVFPSYDPHVYVYAKNKERFERMGVVIPVPAYDVLITPLDKYRTILAAQAVGFPCPRTFIPESNRDLRSIADEIGFPLVIKPRFTAGGRGICFVRNFAELVQKTDLVSRQQGIPLIQEYIPGKDIDRAAIVLVIDQKGEQKLAFYRKVRSGCLRLSASVSTVVEPCELHPYAGHAAALLRAFGWWGGATVQTKIDSRDGLPKLMEINPRLGIGLWERTEIGINEPRMCLQIAKGEEVEEVKSYPKNVTLVQPVEDLVGLAIKLVDLLLYKVRTGVLGKAPVDPTNPPPSLRELLETYKQTYFGGKKKVYNVYFKYLLRDPVVSILWWMQFLTIAFRNANQLGR
jgi:biotin carboxylase